MSRVALFFRRHWFSLGLGIILVFAFFTRIWRLDFTQQYLFDEVYHSVTAKLMARDDPRAFEWWNEPIEPNTAVDWLHPPYAKYTQALGMLIFGENAFGWRISAVIFGVLMVAATAKLAHVIFGNRLVTLLAAGFATLDGLLLVQSRIAMNDIHVTFCILLLYLAYVQYRRGKLALFFVGLAGGFAIGTKWSGMFALGFVGLVYGVEQLWLAWQRRSVRQAVNATAKGSVFLIFLPTALYLFAYIQMFQQGKTLFCSGQSVKQGECYCRSDHSWWVTTLDQVLPSSTPLAQSLISRLPPADPLAVPAKTWGELEARGGCSRLISHFWELHHQIWWYQTTLNATHAYQSRPLQWFLDTKPVWMFVEYPTDGSETIANVYAQGNPLLFWAGDVAILLTAALLFWQTWIWLLNVRIVPAAKTIRARLHLPAFEHVFLLLGYAVLWMPWQLSPRIMFFYHYTPAVPLVCIFLAYWVNELWGKVKKPSHPPQELVLRRAMAIVLIVLIFAAFVIFYPNWTGMWIPKWWAERIYFMLPSWR